MIVSIGISISALEDLDKGVLRDVYFLEHLHLQDIQKGVRRSEQGISLKF